MQNLDKPYIQKIKNTEIIINSYNKPKTSIKKNTEGIIESYSKPKTSIKKNTEGIKELYSKLKTSINSFFKEKDPYSILMNKFLKVNKTTIEIEDEIKNASLHLEKMREEMECFEISEEIWNYSKTILREIYFQHLFRYNIKIPTPKIIIIENSIEIEWVSDNYKLILRLSDYINDISIYLRDKTGPPIYGNVRKDRIINWVVFWLEQFLNS